MYEYIPTGSRAGMKGICTGLFFGAIILFFSSGLEFIKYTAAMQMVAVLMVTLSIMLMGRYLLRHYLYRIADDGEGLDFMVDELSRTGRYTVCRLGLCHLLTAEPWSGENKPRGSAKVYNYCVDIRPRDSWLLEFEDGDDRIYIRLSPDEKMISLFREAIARRGAGERYWNEKQEDDGQ